MKRTRLRWLAKNLDYLRIPLNATERAERQGDVPYWGANRIVDHVDTALLDERVVLVGEDGAPFFDRTKDVAFVSDGPIWPNNHIHILKPNPRMLEDRFLAYFLNHVEYAWYINGSTRDKLTQAQLGNIEVLYPDLDSQKAIADFLDRETARIDALVEKRNAFNALLDEVARSLIADAINGRLIESQERQDAAWLGTVPKTWDMRRMRFIYRERVGRSETGEEELLSASHLTGVTKRSEKEVNMFLAESNVGYKKVMRNDLVVNTMWAWMGAMGISPEEGIISPSYGVYRPIDQRLSPEFADLVVRSPQFTAEATRRSKGIHSSRLRLYTDALYDIVFPVPPLDDQTRLVEQLARRRSRENALREKNEQAIALLQELRASLITAAVTGQIDPATYRRNSTTDRALDRIAEEMTQ
ncbi:restriction endonuclease subunit S [Citreimonas salinaria]|uniref:Type I restriction enzyme, S subunit n=1 Tax=Citreimonas salinaria TaxID=321339 RepID=A0A1H3NA17_9RHOB|nr:restriction endonuclease subunit S [Citreimonas salinaria]SDY85791.1 type I restriction enzyme, S subunit [Citreimonas salinaria]